MPCPTCPTAASLELKSEKPNAHIDYIRSVAFSPNGKTIVSGSDDQTIKVWDSQTLEMIEERPENSSTVGKSGEEADTDGSTLRLKAGGAFYAPSPLVCVAVRWPKVVAGAQSGKLYHLEAMEAKC
jgi:WD40 repeat protein